MTRMNRMNTQGTPDEPRATNTANPVSASTDRGGIQVRWHIHDHDGPNEVWVSFDQPDVCWGT